MTPATPAALAVPCPWCGAAAGAPCTSPAPSLWAWGANGARERAPHLRRRRAAEAEESK